VVLLGRYSLMQLQLAITFQISGALPHAVGERNSEA
jgi:hypothetical protein